MSFFSDFPLSWQDQAMIRYYAIYILPNPDLSGTLNLDSELSPPYNEVNFSWRTRPDHL